jgi:hypothetical protein
MFYDVVQLCAALVVTPTCGRNLNAHSWGAPKAKQARPCWKRACPISRANDWPAGETAAGPVQDGTSKGDYQGMTEAFLTHDSIRRNSVPDKHDLWAQFFGAMDTWSLTYSVNDIVFAARASAGTRLKVTATPKSAACLSPSP